MTSIGLVSIVPKTLSQFYLEKGGVQISDRGVSNVDCRNWWLYKGRGCPQSTPNRNPMGRFKNGGTETGAVVSVSNRSCAGEVCDPSEQHMCGSDDGTPEKSSFDRAPFNRIDNNNLFPQFIWCDGVAGKYLRVWLPGKDRIFEANVLVNRAHPMSPNQLAKVNQNECAVKTASSRPEGATQANVAGKQKLVNRHCKGLKNLNDDGSCCDPTASMVSNAQNRQVVCCADKNPFTPTCASGSTVNVAKESLAMSMSKSTGSDKFDPPTEVPRSLLGDVPKGWVGNANPATIRCDPECGILIDLGQVYDVSELEFVGGRYVDDANDESWYRVAKHDFYAWSGAALGAVPTAATVSSLLREHGKREQSWQHIAGQTGNTNNVVHTLTKPVGTRYIKMWVSQNSGAGNKRLSLQKLSISGCDPDGTKAVVPHLRGKSDPGYIYGTSLSPDQIANTREYPFVKYGWDASHKKAGGSNRPKCTTSWGMSSLGGCGSFGYNAAKSMCANIGGRLCTADEVTNGCTSHWHFGDVCQKGDVWTSTKCDRETTGLCSKDGRGSATTDDDTVVCYGVEAQVAADTSTPEYVISHDPEDSIFYSTCYVRERSVGFEPPPGGQALAKGDFSAGDNESTVYNSAIGSTSTEWKANGACLSCSSYASNKGVSRDDSQAPPRWTVNDENACRSCVAQSDLLLSACNATMGQNAAQSSSTSPCFKTSESLCSASGSIVSSAACKEAVAVVTAHPPLDEDFAVMNIDSAAHPSGCSIQRVQGVLSSYFNKRNGSTTSCLADADTSLAGTINTTILTSLAAKIVPEDKSVILTMRGPAEGWFAFGFGAKRMGDFPYTLVVEAAMSNVKVSEWRLGSVATIDF